MKCTAENTMLPGVKWDNHWPIVTTAPRQNYCKNTHLESLLPAILTVLISPDPANSQAKAPARSTSEFSTVVGFVESRAKGDNLKALHAACHIASPDSSLRPTYSGLAGLGSS
jgi:hypothetical protein